MDINEGRFTLFPKQWGKPHVLIRDLNPTDAGTYRIGVSSRLAYILTLNVEEGQSFV